MPCLYVRYTEVNPKFYFEDFFNVTCTPTTVYFLSALISDFMHLP